ncbi:hypothetical protein C2G38_2150184 [Gigaspora rosea]|uniref:Uncharacterized protein n=1 Tax=Gigaspora rosea TaxID=44941 RepID=A0A397TX73_9GLOM|nr:hypothetical protein C2G38_2150184 [Gigaspora rosea]
MTKKIVLYLIDKSQLNYNNSKMPKISKRKAHIRKAIQASVDAQKVACHNKQIHEINQILTQMDNSELQLAYQIIVQSNSQRIVQSNSQSIIQSDSQSIVQSNSQSSNNQSIVQSNSQRIVQSNSQSIVRSNSQSIVQSTSQSTNNRLMLRQKLINIVEQLPDDQLKTAVHLFDTMRYSKGPNKGKLLSSFLQDKASNFIKASLYKPSQDPSLLIQSNKTLQKKTDQLEHSNTKKYFKVFFSGENLTLPTSHVSVVRWNQEISEIHINQILNKNNCSTFFTLGIVVDESTRGQQKIFVLCIIFWNSKTNLPDFQLLEMKDLASCTGKSVAQAIYDTFSHFKINFHQCFVCVSDNTNYMSGKSGGAITLFNKISEAKITRIPCGLHVAHIIMNNFEETAFGKLPNISGFSQKEHPANLLYLVWDLHNGYNKSDKDKPMGIRSDYIYKLYEERFQYYQTSKQTNLPPGRRAHQMAEFVTRTIMKLQNIIEDPYSFFEEELLESTYTLDNHQLNKLTLDIERGTQKALELYQKWLNCWLHLPLSICRLGGKYGQEFARSYAYVILKTPWISVPSL